MPLPKLILVDPVAELCSAWWAMLLAVHQHNRSGAQTIRAVAPSDLVVILKVEMPMKADFEPNFHPATSRVAG